MKYAPETLTALGSARLIHYHSAKKLFASLTSSRCWSCGAYGAYLHLPTCFRCCYRCHDRNQSLWVLPLAQASTAFGLPMSTITQKLPVMRNLPRPYSFGSPRIRQRRNEMVGVRAAKELALHEGKIEDGFARLLRNIRGESSWHDYYITRWAQRASIHPPLKRLPVYQSDEDCAHDRFCGMASIPFPSLSGWNTAFGV